MAEEFKECPVCGNLVKPFRGKIYCSDKCRRVVINQRAKEYYRINSVKKPIKTRHCSCCGVEFQTHVRNKKYCSESCRKKSWRETCKEITEKKQKEKALRKKEPKKPILYINESEARNNGLSYGQYNATKVSVIFPSWVKVTKREEKEIATNES